MSLRRVTLVGAFAALVLACETDGAPQDSSGSHWLRCQDDTDCTPHDPAATCNAEQYCLDADGMRLEDPGSAPSPVAASSPTITDGVGGAGGSSGQAGESSGGRAGSASDPGGCPELPSALPTANVFEGDYVITGQSSIDAAQLFTEVTGSLLLGQRATADFEEVVLPGLERVGGSVAAEQSRLSRLVLPRVVSIGGDLTLNDNQALSEVTLTNLVSITGTLTLNANPSLLTLSLPALETVGGFDFGAPQPHCLIQQVYDTLGSPADYGGRTDCTCEMVCERWTASCP